MSHAKAPKVGGLEVLSCCFYLVDNVLVHVEVVLLLLDEVDVVVVVIIVVVVQVVGNAVKSRDL